MANILEMLRGMQLHPIADHFTIALLIVAVFIDLVASVFSSRAWLRYMALTLMVMGALATAASWATGGELQPQWVFKTLPPAAKALMHRHAELGEVLMYVFAALAIWRILIESLSFVAGTRWLYLIVAIIAVAVIGYQGHLGGELVYDYGVGTALLHTSATATPAESGAAASPGAIPTVTVPSPTPTPISAPPAAPAAASPATSPAASPEAKASARPEASPKPSPSAKPTGATL
jgi:uncharacterized membrane protein